MQPNGYRIWIWRRYSFAGARLYLPARTEERIWEASIPRRNRWAAWGESWEPASAALEMRGISPLFLMAERRGAAVRLNPRILAQGAKPQFSFQERTSSLQMPRTRQRRARLTRV